MKQLLVLFAIILTSILEVYADDDKWVDGIRLRLSQNNYLVTVRIPKDESLSKKYGFKSGKSLFDTSDKIKHLQDKSGFPLQIVFSESTISTWIYYGSVFDVYDIEHQDLAPTVLSSKELEEQGITQKGFGNIRQPVERRNYLINEFFNNDDLNFISGLDNWALSGDAKIKGINFGFFIGAFYPAFKNQRFLKLGIGPSFYYAEYSLKLKICEEYFISGGGSNYDGQCKGKIKYIDNYKKQMAGYTQTINGTIWERITNDSIWRLFHFEISEFTTTRSMEFEKHTSLDLETANVGLEIISYTYRFN